MSSWPNRPISDAQYKALQKLATRGWTRAGGMRSGLRGNTLDALRRRHLAESRLERGEFEYRITDAGRLTLDTPS